MSITDDTPAFNGIRKRWSAALRKVFTGLPDPDWLRTTHPSLLHCDVPAWGGAGRARAERPKFTLPEGGKRQHSTAVGVAEAP